MPVDAVYCGELWCYLHMNSSHIENFWFEGYHEKLYPGVHPSWPDEVYEEAEDENAAIDLDTIASSMATGGFMIILFGGVPHLLMNDVCSVCYHTTLINVDAECFRCGQSRHK